MGSAFEYLGAVLSQSGLQSEVYVLPHAAAFWAIDPSAEQALPMARRSGLSVEAARVTLTR
jgi:hypothetical protein